MGVIPQQDMWPAATPCSLHDGYGRAALLVGAGYKALWIAADAKAAGVAKALAERHARRDIFVLTVNDIVNMEIIHGIEIGSIVVDPAVPPTERARIPFSELLLRIRIRGTHILMSTPNGGDSSGGHEFDAIWHNEAEYLAEAYAKQISALDERKARIVELLGARGLVGAMWGSRVEPEDAVETIHRLFIGLKSVLVPSEKFTLSNYDVTNWIVDQLRRYAPNLLDKNATSPGTESP
jgi:hypothetical protein